MNVLISPKPTPCLISTPLLQQTGLWANIKNRLGWSVMAFDAALQGKAAGDMLVMLKSIDKTMSFAYVPYGPETKPEDEAGGSYLAALSDELRRYIPADCVFIRWDLPWESPYAQEHDRYDAQGYWLGAPETKIREARMNFGVRRGRLYKAPSDILPPDTLLLDVNKPDDIILSEMKQKTRYNVRLAAKKGVTVRQGGLDDIAVWNSLYADTAKRNGMTLHGGKHFLSALSASIAGQSENVSLLIAEKEGKALAAMFFSISADRASYLYGASSSADRSCMAPYALQWEALKKAKKAGCTTYDFFGLAPRPDPGHPMYGLYTFKTGFGGTLFHRQGSWDYAYNDTAYMRWIAFESASSGFLC